MRRRVALILVAAIAPWLAIVAVLAAQEKPNPCAVVVFKETADSLYAELQAPRGTKRCVVEIR